MGRSPFFMEQVRPELAHHDEFPSFLQSWFDKWMTNATELGDGCRGVKVQGMSIRFLETNYEPPLRLERSCSVYRGVEVSFPISESEYPITAAIQYTFRNKHSNFQPFVYNIIEVKGLQGLFPTFVVRTDGAILNCESFTLRGHVFKAEIIDNTVLPNKHPQEKLEKEA